MRFVTLEREGYAEPGVLLGGELIGIGGAGFDSVLSVIAGGADAMDRVRRWLKNPPPGEPFHPARTRLATSRRKEIKAAAGGFTAPLARGRFFFSV